MTLPLLEVAERAPMAEASLEAFAHITETLTEREIVIFTLVCDYVARTGYPDVSGAELAQWAGWDKTSVRPRCTGLVDKGWLTKGPIRLSRATGEGRCHVVAPAVPRAAIERLRNQQKEA